MAVNRRAFLKIAGASALGLGVGSKSAWELLNPGAALAEQNAPLAVGRKWAMVVDMRKWTEEDAKVCIKACHSYHNVPDIRLPNGEPNKKEEITTGNIKQNSDISLQHEKGDSVKVTLKDETVYIGVIQEKLDKGFFILVENNREVYLKYNTVKEIQTLSSTKEGPEQPDYVQQKETVSDNNKSIQDGKKSLPRKSESALTLFLLGLIIPVVGIIMLFASIFFAKKGKTLAEMYPDKYNYKGARTIYFVILGYLIFLILVSIALVIVFMLI